VRLAALRVSPALTDGITGGARVSVVSGVARAVVSVVRAVSTDRAGAESLTGATPLAGAAVSALAGRLVSGLLVLVDSAFVSSALATVSGAEELALSDLCLAGAAVATIAESPFAELSLTAEVSRAPPGA